MSKLAARILVIGFLAFLFFPALGLGQQEELEEETAQFTGRVLDLEKNPIAQAGLQLKNLGTGKTLSGSTSKKGEFAFRLLAPGKFSLTVAKEGYLSISKEIDLQAGTAPKVEIALAREPSEEQKKRKEALALFQNGISLAQADKLDEALAAFRKATELKPDFAEAQINLGLLLLRQGKPDEAEGALLKALELRPDETRTKDALASIYFDKAKELLPARQVRRGAGKADALLRARSGQSVHLLSSGLCLYPERDEGRGHRVVRGVPPAQA